jgi:hypothetical protein
VLYYHAVAGFPPKETFLDAAQAGNYTMWPGLTTQLINKRFPDSDETQKGEHEGAETGGTIHQTEGTGLQCGKGAKHQD